MSSLYRFLSGEVPGGFVIFILITFAIGFIGFFLHRYSTVINKRVLKTVVYSLLIFVTLSYAIIRSARPPKDEPVQIGVWPLEFAFSGTGDSASYRHYGLGWAVDEFGNQTAVRHGGSIGGYRAEGIRIPEDHLYVLLLSNTATTNSGLTANRILSILYDKSGLEEKKAGQQSWKEVEGVYASPNAGLRLQTNFGPRPAYITIRVDSLNRVTAQRTGGTASTLSPAGKDTLFDKNNPFQAWVIQRNAAGAVEGIRFRHYFPNYGPERFNPRTSGQIPTAPVPAKADSAALAKFTGWYEHPFGERVQVRYENGQLFMEQPPVNSRTTLHWLQGNTCWVKETDMEVKFDADAKGRITGMRFHTGFHENILRRVEEIYLP